MFPEKSPLGCEYIKVNNFFVCGPKYTNFFHPTWEGLQIFKNSSDFRYVDPLWRYSRSKSKVVKNRVEFWTFFGRHKFLGAGLVKIVPKLSSLPHGHRLKKSPVRVLPLRPLARKLLTLKRWIFGQILNFRDQFFSFLGGTPSHLGVCASKAWSVFSPCKNFRAQARSTP